MNLKIKDFIHKLSFSPKAFLSQHTWAKNTLFVLSFLFLWLYLSNFSSQTNNKNVFDYQAEIFADRAGYYVYLPATFIYGFSANEFPAQVDEKTGRGFELDTVTNKIKTKYTCGIAILSAPFFITNHIYQKAIGEPATGFTKSYFKIANYASIFYLLIGMVFLFMFLKTRFKTKHVLLTLLTLFLATNLFFYSIVHTFMSHVFTFSMMSFFLWAFQKHITTQKIKYFILLSIASGFILLIRPINVLFLFLCLFIDIQSFKDLKERFFILLKPINIVLIITIVFLIFLPQLLYYKYLSGSFLYYSYGNEGFTNLFSPKIKEVLFSPMNGLLLYTPIYILFLFGSIYQLFKKDFNGIVTLFTFLLMLFISSSWWCWSWGCSFSMRPFVDILPILAISLTSFYKVVTDSKSWILKILLGVIIFYFSYANIQFSRNYAQCFMGGEWDWMEYHQMMKKNKVFPFNTQEYQSYFCKESRIPFKIKSADHHFITTGEQGTLQKSDHPISFSEAETFQLIELERSQISIVNSNGKYLCSDLGLNGLCVANRDQIGQWEKFVIHNYPDGSLALANSTGHFVVIDTLNNNQLIAKTTSLDSAAHFRFIY